MAGQESFTLSDIARRLDVPQHRLIHLCEKGVVVPDVHDAAGRGSSRVFSTRNFLELAVALRLREMLLPVTAVAAILHVLRALEDQLRDNNADFSLAGDLRQGRSPDLRVIISDGQRVFFSLAAPGQEPRLFGGIPFDKLSGSQPDWDGSVAPVQSSTNGRKRTAFGGPEQSHFARLELSVTTIAKSLPLD